MRGPPTTAPGDPATTAPVPMAAPVSVRLLAAVAGDEKVAVRAAKAATLAPIKMSFRIGCHPSQGRIAP